MLGRFRDFFPKRRQLKDAQDAFAAAESPVPAAPEAPPAPPQRTDNGEADARAITPAQRTDNTDARLLTPAQRTGSAGEEAAAAFLVGKGHRVIERNWRAGRDEIDLITKDGAALVFVEVRTRAQSALVGGYHSIDARKKAALRRVCGAYLNTCRPRPQTYRLDVVQISMGKGGQMEIHHYVGIALFN